MIYTDPKVGSRYGYKYDGWDDELEVFYYTGEGRIGSQRMTAGNAAILNHVNDGRALRLFETKTQTPPGSNTKLQEYIGEFGVDAADPYRVADAPDQEGDPRTVFVFKLRPVGTVEKDTGNQSDVVDETRVSVELVPPESTETEEFERHPPSTSVKAIRRESALVADFRTFLEKQAHEVLRYKIYTPGSVSPLLTDLYDVTESVLYEAKASAGRGDIRLAIGQLLDYHRYMPDGIQLAVLLPARPNEELIDLLTSLGMKIVYQNGPGKYEWI
jgi:hypothetical protein